jgi:predicted phage tail protein
VTLTKNEDGRRRSPDNDPEETFDMSGFCTSQEHAETFAKYALKTRQLVDHGIKFQTTPQMAMGLEPGEYFQVASAVTHSDTDLGSRLNNGSIDSEGNIIGLDLDSDTYEVQYWKPGTQGLNTAQLQVVERKTSNNALWGSIFAVSRRNNPQTRVYKLESLTYAEDGLVEVAGSVAPLTEGGSLATLDWGDDNDDHFTVRAA